MVKVCPTSNRLKVRGMSIPALSLPPSNRQKTTNGNILCERNPHLLVGYVWSVGVGQGS